MNWNIDEIKSQVLEIMDHPKTQDRYEIALRGFTIEENTEDVGDPGETPDEYLVINLCDGRNFYIHKNNINY